MDEWTRLSLFIVRFNFRFDSLYYLSSRRVYGYSTAASTNAAFIIGGDRTRDVIAEFKNNAWRNLGSLNRPRNSHASISLNGETMIIGGYSSVRLVIIYDLMHLGNIIFSALETEIWNFVAENNKIINPTLPHNHYAYGVALYLVPFDFCT